MLKKFKKIIFFFFLIVITGKFSFAQINPKATFTGHSGSVYSIAFSPDGKSIASGSGDNTIKLWDIASGKELKTFTGHSDGVLSIAFSPDGKFIASGSSDKTIKLWDISDLK